MVLNGERAVVMRPRADTLRDFPSSSYQDILKCDDYFDNVSECPFNSTTTVRMWSYRPSPASTNFYVSSMGVKTTYKKPMVDPCTKYFFPLMTVIIRVVNGVVEGVNWEDGCYMCVDVSWRKSVSFKRTTLVRMSG